MRAPGGGNGLRLRSSSHRDARTRGFRSYYQAWVERRSIRSGAADGLSYRRLETSRLRLATLFDVRPLHADDRPPGTVFPSSGHPWYKRGVRVTASSTRSVDCCGLDPAIAKRDAFPPGPDAATEIDVTRRRTRKILHEIRSAIVRGCARCRFGRYYGSVDATRRCR